MEFLTENLNDVWKYRNIVVSKVSILELLREYKISLEEIDNGQFSHRAICPFHNSTNGGRENMPSLYISKNTNSFYCFGPCDAHGTVIDLVSLVEGTPPMIAISKLAKRIGLINKDGSFDDLQIDSYGSEILELDNSKTIEPYLFDISDIIRNHILKYIGTNGFEERLKKIEGFAEKLDKAIAKLDFGDWEEAEKLYIKVKAKLRA